MSDDRITFSIKKKTLDNLIRASSVVAAIDFVIIPFVAHSVFGGEYKALHQYLGLPPEMSETAVKGGGAYWGLTMLYEIFLRNKFLGKDTAREFSAE